MTPSFICSCCGEYLTPVEADFYGNTCDRCEREWSERVEAWRHGAHDPELDAFFTSPAASVH